MNDGNGVKAPVTVGGVIDVIPNGSLNLAGEIDFTPGSVVNVNATRALGSAFSIRAPSHGGSATLTGSNVIINLSDTANARASLTDGDGGFDASLDNQITIQSAGYFGHNDQVNFYVANEGTGDANGVNNMLLRDATLNNKGGAPEVTNTGGLTIQARTFSNTGQLIASGGGAMTVGASTFDDVVGNALTGGSFVVGVNSSIAFNSAAPITTLAASLSLGAGASFTTAVAAFGKSLTTIASGGQLTIGGATFNGANPITIQAGGLAGGFGAFNAALIDNALISATGPLTFDQAVSGSGAVSFSRGAGVEFVGASSVATIAFDATPPSTTLDTLTLDNPAAFTSTIANFEPNNDRIVLKGVSVASVSLSGPNSGTGLSTLTAKNAAGATLAQPQLSGNFAGLIPVVASDGSTRLTTQRANDFNGDGASDLLFKDAAGNYATWDLNDGAVRGVSNFGSPGASWTEKAFV